MAVTIRDVAIASNSSITSVSRVLNNCDYPVSDKLRKRILKAAKELNYVPNLTARSLKMNTGTEIAVVLPSIINPYYTTIIKGMEDHFFRENLGMLIYITNKNKRSPEKIVESVRGRQVAGIIAATDSVNDALLSELISIKEAGTPVVLLDYPPINMNSQGIYGVFCDYYKGASMATEYLLKMGHRNIAFATTHLDRQSRVLRYNGFRDTMQSNGVDFDDSDLLICPLESTYDAGVELAGMIINASDRITAVAAINDAVAAAIVTGLNMRGVRVPDEISVIGFDNADIARMTHPLLTSVDVSAEEMGNLAATSLISEIKGNEMKQNIDLEPIIVERKSVKCII